MNARDLSEALRDAADRVSPPYHYDDIDARISDALYVLAAVLEEAEL